MKKIFFIILASLLFSTTARADKSLVNEEFEADMVKAVVKKLTENRSVEDFWDPKEKLLKGNQYYIQNMTQALKGKKPPQVRYNGKKSIIFEEAGQKVEMEFISVLQQKFKVNGVLVDFRPYRTMQDRHNFMERVLKPKSHKQWMGVVAANAVSWGSVVSQAWNQKKKDENILFAVAFVEFEDQWPTLSKLDFQCRREPASVLAYQAQVSECICSDSCKNRLMKAVNDKNF